MTRFKRHSNSIKIKEQGCHCGSKLQPQFTVPEKRSRVNVGDESPSKSAGLGTSVQRGNKHYMFRSLAMCVLNPFSSYTSITGIQ